MYNYAKFVQESTKKQTLEHERRKFHKWQLKHKQQKEKSHQKCREKVQSFIKKADLSPFYHQDDHFDQWRIKNRYRDMKNQQKFLGYKAFIHKSNQDMQSLSNERQRIEKTQHSLILSQSKHLATAQLIMRNQQSQGPFEIIDKYKPDLKCDQPHMKWKSVTDKQRFLEQCTSEAKFMDVVYSKYQDKKQKIGISKVSPLRPTKKNSWKYFQDIDKSVSRNVSEVQLNTENNPQEHQEINKKIKLAKLPLAKMPEHSHYELQNSDRTALKMNSLIEKVNSQMLAPLQKIPLKSMKQMGLGSMLASKNTAKQKEIEKLSKRVLLKCQVARKKYLDNIQHNNFGESYEKSPIL